MERARGIPILVDDSGARSSLERIHLGLGLHSEDWLQALIQAEPQILPIIEIEPGFGEPVAVAREIFCGHGIIDNLYLTPSGDIVLVETKLWRNSEMRREVVAQALDYVSALTAMSYGQFEQAIGLVAVWFRSLVSHYATLASKAKGLMPPRYEWRLRTL